MHSSCGRYVITFNGEIYNFKACDKNWIHWGKRSAGIRTPRSCLPRIAHWGVEDRTKKVQRHVRVLRFGTARSEDIVFVARSCRRKATLLRLGGQHFAIQLRTQGSASSSCISAPRLIVEPHRLSPSQLYSCATFDLQRNLQAAPQGRLLAIRGFGSRRFAEAVLVRQTRRRRWAWSTI